MMSDDSTKTLQPARTLFEPVADFATAKVGRLTRALTLFLLPIPMLAAHRASQNCLSGGSVAWSGRFRQVQAQTFDDDSTRLDWTAAGDAHADALKTRPRPRPPYYPVVADQGLHPISSTYLRVEVGCAWLLTILS